MLRLGFSSCNGASVLRTRRHTPTSLYAMRQDGIEAVDAEVLLTMEPSRQCRNQTHNCENLNGGVPGWSDPNPQGPRHVPSERFVGQTGDVVTAPLRAGRDFIGECAFDQEGLVAVVSALLRLSSEREQLLIDL